MAIGFLLLFPFKSKYILVFQDDYVFTKGEEIKVFTEIKKAHLCLNCNQEELNLKLAVKEVFYDSSVADVEGGKYFSFNIENLEEGEYESFLTLFLNGEEIQSRSFKLIVDKSPAFINDLENGYLDELNNISISTRGEHTKVKFIFNEDVILRFICEEDESTLLDNCNKKGENYQKEYEILLNGEVMEEEKSYEIKLEVYDKAENLSGFKIFPKIDGTPPVATLISEKIYNVREFTHCKKSYSLKVSLDEEGKVLVDGQEMAYNEVDKTYERSFVLEEGVRKFEFIVTDKFNNSTNTIIEVDGVCRTSSPYGEVHPWCYQRGLIACSSTVQGYDPCVANYIKNSCSQYH